MKNTRNCSKCECAEIYTNKGISKRGDRSSIGVTGGFSGRFFVDTYICSNCGFIEEYVEKEYLESKEKMLKLKENWQKI